MKKATQLKKKVKVRYLTVSDEDAGQRIDNFLIPHFKGVPKSRIYRLLRKGEVRVNKRRVEAYYKIQTADIVRLPPVYLAEQGKSVPPSEATLVRLKNNILYEDEQLLVLNKPSGLSVHVGSTIRVGVIEAMRYLYPHLPQLELAHRLDSDTSGCLILAKKKRVLRELHILLREGLITKLYWAFTKGIWKKSEQIVEQPLHKSYQDGIKHVVEVKQEGKASLTTFKPIQVFKQGSLMEARLHTGRTHQIRVHAAYQGHPIAGDDRYGEAEFNKWASHQGLKRLFLHARSIDFVLPSTGQRITVTAPLDLELEEFMHQLEINEKGHK